MDLEQDLSGDQTLPRDSANPAKPDAEELHSPAASLIGAPRPAALQRRLRHTASRIGWPLAAMTAMLGLWQLTVRVFDIQAFILPAPSAILTEVWASRVQLAQNTIATLLAILGGFALAVVVSAPLAFLVVYSPVLEKALYPLLVFSTAIPKIAIAPIVVVWFGFGILPKLLIAFLVCFFPIVIDTAIGLRSVPPEMIDLVKTMGGSRLDTFRRVRIPNALPYFFSGLKVATTLAVVGAVVGEFIGATSGLGFVIVQASSYLDTRLLFASIFVLTLVGIILFYCVDALERLVLPWHVTQRSGQSTETIQATNLREMY